MSAKSAADTEHNSITEDEDDARVERAQTLYSRRQALKIGAGAAATVAVATTSGLPAAAESDKVPNYGGSDRPHDPMVKMTTTVGDTDFSDDMEPLEYVNDEGEVTPLSDHGIVMQPNEDDDTAYQPVEVDPVKFDGGLYTDFPRNVDDADLADDETADDVSLIDSTSRYTSTNMSVSSSEWGITLSGDGSNAGNAEFDDFTKIVSDLDIRNFQIVVNVKTIPASGQLEFQLRDSNGSAQVTYRIDTDGDTSKEKVITDSEGKTVYQSKLGDAGSVSEIDDVYINLTSAESFEVEIAGFNLDSKADWEYGTEEYLDGNGDIQTRTITSPTGTFTLRDASDLQDDFGDGSWYDLSFDVEQRISETNLTDTHRVRVSDSDAREYKKELEVVRKLEIPSAFSLSHNVSELVDQRDIPTSRYISVESVINTSAANFDDDDSDDFWSSVEDDVSWTDETSAYDSGDIDTDLTLRNSGMGSGDEILVYHYLNLPQEELDETLTSPGSFGGGAAAASGGSGFLSSLPAPLNSVWTWAGTGVAGTVAYIMGIIPGVGPE